MKIQILNDLYNEINRLFIAGSKFAKGDPRIIKLLPTLQKMGEKAPAMRILAQQVEALVNAEPNDSMTTLADTGIFLYSILNTQGSSEADESFSEYEQAIKVSEMPETKTPYSKLKPIIEALTTSNSGRLEILQEAFKGNAYDDFRLYEYYSRGLGDKYPEIVELLAKSIIPALKEKMVPYLLKDFIINGNKADARRLSLLDNLDYENVYELAEKALDETKVEEIHVEAIKILGRYPKNEQLLLELSQSKKQSIREAALLALVRMDSLAGKERLIKILNGRQFKSGIEAAKSCHDKEYNKKIFNIVENKFVLVKTAKDEKEKNTFLDNFDTILNALGNKRDDYVFNFYKMVLKEKTLTEIKHYLHYYRFICEEINRLPQEEGLSFYEETCTPEIIKIHHSSYVESYYAYASDYMSPDEMYNTFVRFYENNNLNTLQVYNRNIVLSKKWIPSIIKKKDISLMIFMADKETEELNKRLFEYVKDGTSAKKIDSYVLGAAIKLSELLENDQLEALKHLVFDVLVAQKKRYIYYDNDFKYNFVQKLYQNTDYETKLKQEADNTSNRNFKDLVKCFDQ